MRIFFICLLTLGTLSWPLFAQPANRPPAWASQAIWYQVFPERFCNGDTTNDPTKEDIIGSYPGFIPEGWTTTPWTHDWYAPDPWFSEMEGKKDPSGYTVQHFAQFAQLRRYGGDLQGVLDKIPYLDSLGVNAIYFNPLNDAPSLHKYDARNWRHVDRNFGPDPSGDKAIMASENPLDPSSWQYTAADSMFLQVIRELHARDMKVILDYSWNHTGTQFWAWQDILQNQEASEYKDWYWIKRFDDPATDSNEFSYRGWAGVPGLPEIRETVHADHAEKVFAFEGDVYLDTVKQHIFAITKRWMDPNGDGDPSDGVDGFRLDVAAEMPLGFWRDYRRHVKSINPEAYLIGEIWWEQFPDHLLDPAPYLQGDIFDAVMNYRWYRAARHLISGGPYTIRVSDFIDSLRIFGTGISMDFSYAMMNMTASHDVPRLSTSLYNKNKYKYDAHPTATNGYRINRPDEATWQTLRLLLVHQFTFYGAPQIWAGDEMGMWGSDDPSSRKPLIWPEYRFDREATHPEGIRRPVDKVEFDKELFGFYRKLISIRKEQIALIDGDFKVLHADDAKQTWVYSRSYEEDQVLTAFNLSHENREIMIPCGKECDYIDTLGNIESRITDGNFIIRMEGRSAAILVRR